MKKKINWQQYYVKQDLGFTKRYIQNGLEYDEEGFSIKDFPTAKELDEKEVREIDRMKSSPNRYYFSKKSNQPYQSVDVAKAVVGKRKWDTDKVIYHEFSRGVVIEYNG